MAKPDTAGRRPPATAAPRVPPRSARLFTLGLTVLSGVILLPGIGRPAYWLDEATTVMIAHRSWWNLLRVGYYTDTPLAPYYVLIKLWSSLGTSQAWFRLPSALAIILAAVLLGRWVGDRFGRWTGAGAVLILLMLPGTLRYAHEARPYGLVIFAVVLSSWAWWRWQERPGWLRAVVYAGSVALIPLFNLLALTVVPAHVIAGLARPGGVRRATSTMGAAVAGLLPLTPFLVLTVRHAHGCAHPPPPSLDQWWKTMVGMFSAFAAGDSRVQLIAATMLILAALGLFRLRDLEHRDLVVLAAAWAVTTPLLLGVFSVFRATLIQRYFLVALPGWSILAVEGIVLLTLAVRNLLPSRPRTVAPIATTVAAVPLITLLILAAPLQLQFRTTTGHGNGDIRTVLAELNSPPLADLPIYVAPHNLAIIPFAYEPDLYSRMPVARDPSNSGSVLKSDLPESEALQRWESIPTLLLVQLGTPDETRKTAQEPLFADYEVTEVREFDRWTVITLARES